MALGPLGPGPWPCATARPLVQGRAPSSVGLVVRTITLTPCTGQGPRPNGTWGPALWHNTWPFPQWTCDLDLGTPWGLIWTQKLKRDHSVLNVKSESFPINSNLVRSVIAWKYQVSKARYCFGEYRCWIAFWRQEPLSMPLPLFPTEHPLRTDGIGPAFTQGRSGSNHNTSTYLKQENRVRSGGWQFWREQREKRAIISKEKGANDFLLWVVLCSKTCKGFPTISRYWDSFICNRLLW